MANQPVESAEMSSFSSTAADQTGRFVPALLFLFIIPPFFGAGRVSRPPGGGALVLSLFYVSGVVTGSGYKMNVHNENKKM